VLSWSKPSPRPNVKPHTPAPPRPATPTHTPPAKTHRRRRRHQQRSHVPQRVGQQQRAPAPRVAARADVRQQRRQYRRAAGRRRQRKGGAGQVRGQCGGEGEAAHVDVQGRQAERQDLEGWRGWVWGWIGFSCCWGEVGGSIGNALVRG